VRFQSGRFAGKTTEEVQLKNPDWVRAVVHNIRRPSIGVRVTCEEVYGYVSAPASDNQCSECLSSPSSPRTSKTSTWG
jgi:hypothetical protein